MRYLIAGLIALATPFAAVGCVQEQIPSSEPTPGPEPTAQAEQTAAPTPRPEQAAAAALPTFELRAKADGESKAVFAVSAPEGEGKPGGFFALEEIETADGAKLRPIQSVLAAGIEFPIPLNDREAKPLGKASSLVVVRDSEREHIQRVFIFCASPEGFSSVAEIVYDPEPAENGKSIIEIGRIFTVPVQGPVQGRIVLRPSADRTQLFVNLDAPAGNSKQPMTLLYDIRADSKSLDPTDIRMVPKM